MIVNYILKTGLTTSFSGNYSTTTENNQAGTYANAIYYVDPSLRTGLNDIMASINGQTLLERTPSQFSTPYGFVYSGSGDFYSQSGQYQNIIINKTGIQNLSEKNFIFDTRSGVECPVGVGSTGQMLSGIRVEISGKLPNFTGINMTGLDFFVNGQKIYSGSVSGSYLISGNQFHYRDSATGKLFAFPKKTGVLDFTGTAFDQSSYRFIEKNSNLYINGLEYTPESWLESNLCVRNCVKSGIQAKISSDVSSSEFVSI
jgi:hypothetical protein